MRWEKKNNSCGGNVCIFIEDGEDMLDVLRALMLAAADLAYAPESEFWDDRAVRDPDSGDIDSFIEERKEDRFFDLTSFFYYFGLSCQLVLWWEESQRSFDLVGGLYEQFGGRVDDLLSLTVKKLEELKEKKAKEIPAPWYKRFLGLPAYIIALVFSGAPDF